MDFALVLFTMFYTPKSIVPFYTPPAVIEQVGTPMFLPTKPVENHFRDVRNMENVATQSQTPQEFYQYTCPEGQYPIGDGQCHISNDRPGDIEK